MERAHLRHLVIGITAVTLTACSTSTSTSSPRSRKHDSAVATTRGQTERREAQLEAWVTAEATRLGGREFSVTRLRAEGDIDRDGRSDLIWVYRLDGIAGLESFEQFLAVQLSTDPRPVRSISVGKSGGRSISAVRVVDGKVELNAQEYLPTDQSCCPTGHAQVWVGLRSRRLEFLIP